MKPKVDSSRDVVKGLGGSLLWVLIYRIDGVLAHFEAYLEEEGKNLKRELEA